MDSGYRVATVADTADLVVRLTS